MRLLTLSVEAYQAIERASVELGPGLNILYGPNDIGKSTLASALRSVLLVPPTSTVAEGFSSWYADAPPHVSVTFMDETQRYWKLQKDFGSGSADAATLSHSKDGQSYTSDCRSRQVEEKVRALLGWGIPAPGGRGGPKGLPTSFLATVLLGTQTDVDGILAKSLANDDDETGKLRLTKALAVLAQDPVFKQVLDAAQTEVDCYFTAKDKKKTGQASKFTHASNRVKELQGQLTALEAELNQSTAIETLIVSLRERFAQSTEAVNDSAQHFEVLQSRAGRERARAAARLALDVARTELAGADAHAERIAQLDAEIEQLEARVAEREADARRFAAELDASTVALQSAEEAHRLATGEGAERERELRRAQCAEKAAGAAQRRQALEARRDRVRLVLEARGAVEQGAQTVARAQADRDNAAREHAAAQSKLQALDLEHGEWLATIAYARWRSASEAAAEHARVLDAAKTDQAEAESKDAEADLKQSSIAERTAGLASRVARLPSPDDLSSLLQLEQDLQVAEAALGGGLSVNVKGRAGLAGRVSIDGQAARDLPALDVEQSIEAEGRLLLAIEDLLQVEIRAGAADKRSAADALRARRVAEVVPVLERAGLTSLAEVKREATKLDAERGLVDQAHAVVTALRAEARSLRQRAAERQLLSEQLAVRAGDVTARRDAVGTHDIEALKARFDALGTGAGSKAEARAAQCATSVVRAREAVSTRERALTFGQLQLVQAQNSHKETQEALARALAAIDSETPDALLPRLESELSGLAAEEAALRAQVSQLMAASSAEVTEASRAVAAARERVPLARQALERASASAEAARREHAMRQGERSALQTQLEAFNRDALNATVRQRETELAAFGLEPDLPPTALEAAEQRLELARRDQERAKEELNHAEGKLSSAGGAALRENVDRMRDALQDARDDEAEVEVEAEAWKLLRNTLREVENAEGAHLGRALAGPLTARFRALTADRYPTLQLDPRLKVEGVGAGSPQATGPEVLAALSVGTRDQLATLIRLAIAEELGSAIVLDDHLVHSDPKRLSWFRQALVKTAVRAQVIVLTCRPQDYLTDAEMPQTAPFIDLAGGAIRAIDLARVVTRYRSSGSQSPPESNVEPRDQARAS